jgi:hypothetical protein
MRAAPPVSVRCADGGAWRAFCAVVSGCSAAALVYWALAHAELIEQPGGWLTGLAAALVSGGTLAALVWWAQGQGFGRGRGQARGPARLSWTGEQWLLDDDPGIPEVRIDLDRWLLLRFRSSGAGAGEGSATGHLRWLALSAAEGKATWHALRAALYSRPPRTTPATPSAPHRAPTE